MDEIYSKVILTLLTIVTGCLTIASFYNGKSKETKQDGEKSASLRSDIQYIKEMLSDVKQSTKEIKILTENHTQRITLIEEKLNSAYDRIDKLEKQIDNLRGE